MTEQDLQSKYNLTSEFIEPLKEIIYSDGKTALEHVISVVEQILNGTYIPSDEDWWLDKRLSFETTEELLRYEKEHSIPESFKSTCKILSQIELQTDKGGHLQVWIEYNGHCEQVL